MKIIDLSVPMDNRAKEVQPPKIEYESHENGAKQAAALLNLETTDFPNEKAWATETVTLSTHTGTHVDAPWHYGSTSEGEKARTIDELPLEWFFADGVLFDFTNQEPGYEIQIVDFEEQLIKMEYTLKPNDIVLIRSDADKHLYEENYAMMHVGVSAEATHWLIDQGIKVMGTDGWGWDIPLPKQAEQYKKTKEDNILWAAHFVGKEKEYCQIEKLANLDQLPTPTGFKIACFPVNIKSASAGWARPVAIFPY